MISGQVWRPLYRKGQDDHHCDLVLESLWNMGFKIIFSGLQNTFGLQLLLASAGFLLIGYQCPLRWMDTLHLKGHSWEAGRPLWVREGCLELRTAAWNPSPPSLPGLTDALCVGHRFAGYWWFCLVWPLSTTLQNSMQQHTKMIITFYDNMYNHIPVIIKSTAQKVY